MEDIYFYAAFIPIVAYSIILHEIAHAVAALWSGDPTALRANRISLNPVPHIDPFGTILLPGLLMVMNSPVVFGWARPVPVNPFNFRNPVRDDLFVSVAGVTVNFILAFIFILLLHLTRADYLNYRIFMMAAYVNISLAVFNLVPIPPLDGSHVFKYLLPEEMRGRYEMIGMYGKMFIFVFLFLGGHWLHFVDYHVYMVFMFLGGHGWLG